MNSKTLPLLSALLLLIAMVLLVVVSASSPDDPHVSFLNIDVTKVMPVRLGFGLFKFCFNHANDPDPLHCSPSHYGYSPKLFSAFVDQYGDVILPQASVESITSLTKTFILHPIAAGLCAIAFLACLNVNFIGSLISLPFCFIAFISISIALSYDLKAFTILKHDINNGRHPFDKAHWGGGIWCVLCAMLCALVAMLLVFVFSWFRREEKRKSTKDVASD